LAKKEQKSINYSVEFKLMAVKKYIEDDMSYNAIAKELGLYDHKYVSRWVKNYIELGIDGLKERRGSSRSLFKGRPRVKPLSLEEENRKLKMENEFLKKLHALQRR
jgi:transposase